MTDNKRTPPPSPERGTVPRPTFFNADSDPATGGKGNTSHDMEQNTTTTTQKGEVQVKLDKASEASRSSSLLGHPFDYDDFEAKCKTLRLQSQEIENTEKFIQSLLHFEVASADHAALAAAALFLIDQRIVSERIAVSRSNTTLSQILHIFSVPYDAFRMTLEAIISACQESKGPAFTRTGATLPSWGQGPFSPTRASLPYLSAPILTRTEATHTVYRIYTDLAVYGKQHLCRFLDSDADADGTFSRFVWLRFLLASHSTLSMQARTENFPLLHGMLVCSLWECLLQFPNVAVRETYRDFLRPAETAPTELSRTVPHNLEALPLSVEHIASCCGVDKATMTVVYCGYYSFFREEMPLSTEGSPQPETVASHTDMYEEALQTDDHAIFDERLFFMKEETDSKQDRQTPITAPTTASISTSSSPTSASLQMREKNVPVQQRLSFLEEMELSGSSFGTLATLLAVKAAPRPSPYLTFLLLSLGLLDSVEQSLTHWEARFMSHCAGVIKRGGQQGGTFSSSSPRAPSSSSVPHTKQDVPSEDGHRQQPGKIARLLQTSLHKTADATESASSAKQGSNEGSPCDAQTNAALGDSEGESGHVSKRAKVLPIQSTPVSSGSDSLKTRRRSCDGKGSRRCNQSNAAVTIPSEELWHTVRTLFYEALAAISLHIQLQQQQQQQHDPVQPASPPSSPQLSEKPCVTKSYLVPPTLLPTPTRIKITEAIAKMTGERGAFISVCTSIVLGLNDAHIAKDPLAEVNALLSVFDVSAIEYWKMTEAIVQVFLSQFMHEVGEIIARNERHLLSNIVWNPSQRLCAATLMAGLPSVHEATAFVACLPNTTAAQRDAAGDTHEPSEKQSKAEHSSSAQCESNDEGGEDPRRTDLLRLSFKIYHTAYRRLQQLATVYTLPQPEAMIPRIWTAFEHVAMKLPSLFSGRHMDTILLCCTYGVLKSCDEDAEFSKINAAYQELEPSDDVYKAVVRRVLLASGDNYDALSGKKSVRMDAATKVARGHIIIFYNHLFLPSMKAFVLSLCDPTVTLAGPTASPALTGAGSSASVIKLAAQPTPAAIITTKPGLPAPRQLHSTLFLDLLSPSQPSPQRYLSRPPLSPQRALLSTPRTQRLSATMSPTAHRDMKPRIILS